MFQVVVIGAVVLAVLAFLFWLFRRGSKGVESAADSRVAKAEAEQEAKQANATATTAAAELAVERITSALIEQEQEQQLRAREDAVNDSDADAVRDWMQSELSEMHTRDNREDVPSAADGTAAEAGEESEGGG